MDELCDDHWERGAMDGWVKCRKCKLNVSIPTSVKDGCPKCGNVFQPIIASNPVESIHKFYRGDNSPQSTRKILGVYDTRTDQLPEKPDGATRFVCISDTHERHRSMKYDIPLGDVLLHAGDFSLVGEQHQVKDFNRWLASLPHQHKVVIAGNHDTSFEPEYYLKQKPTANPQRIRNELKDCIYLEDSEVVINGIRIYGSPWQPEFCDWAFNLKRGQPLQEKWALIPQGVDVLMTHGPPLGFGDMCYDGRLVGCEDLLKRIQELRPPVHVCGHIHEGRGILRDEQTLYVNACTVNLDYYPVFAPIVFDMS